MTKESPRCIKERLQVLFEGNFSDVTFTVGDEEKPFKAHKCVLAASSQVFGDLFYGPQAESSDTISIPHTDSAVFERMLRYIYLGDVDFETWEAALLTLPVAHQFKLYHLQEVCFLQIFSTVTARTVCKALEVANLYKIDRVAVMLMHFICKNAEEVLLSEGFLNIQADTVKKIISQDRLNVSEFDILQAVILWTYSECDRTGQQRSWRNIRSTAEQFLPELRFQNLTQRDFLLCPLVNKLLNDSESLSILMNIVSYGSFPLPEWCSQKGKRTSVNIFNICSVPKVCDAPSIDESGSDQSVIQCKFTVSVDCIAVVGGQFHWKDKSNHLLREGMMSTSTSNANRVLKGGRLTFHNVNDSYCLHCPVTIEYKWGKDIIVIFRFPLVAYKGETWEIYFSLGNVNITEGVDSSGEALDPNTTLQNDISCEKAATSPEGKNSSEDSRQDPNTNFPDCSTTESTKDNVCHSLETSSPTVQMKRTNSARNSTNQKKNYNQRKNILCFHSLWERTVEKNGYFDEIFCLFPS